MHQYTQELDDNFRLKIIVILLIFIILYKNSVAYEPEKFAAQKANFSIKFKEEISPYRVTGVFVLPKESVTFEVLDSGKNNKYNIKVTEGKLTQIADKKWQWHAPEKKGFYPLVIRDENSSESISLNIFVMVPFKELRGEYLNGFRIGHYPKIPLKKLQIYKPPKGFIEVTEEIENTLISPHFKLNQFLCKQNSGYPKYMVLKERLILKLEIILEQVNERGYHCNTLHVMSGYRTPFYNHSIGNVKYSRHCWGGAADIFIDNNPKDGLLDDLNADGRIDYKDAKIIYDIIDTMYGKHWYEIFVGGLGRYKKTASHGPFVHVDVRGFRARWGD